MYLAEDRVRGEFDVNVVCFGCLYNVLIDPMLGAGIEARRSVDSSLCQVGVRRYGHSRSGAGRSVFD